RKESLGSSGLVGGTRCAYSNTKRVTQSCIDSDDIFPRQNPCYSAHTNISRRRLQSSTFGHALRRSRIRVGVGSRALSRLGRRGAAPPDARAIGAGRAHAVAPARRAGALPAQGAEGAARARGRARSLL